MTRWDERLDEREHDERQRHVPTSKALNRRELNLIVTRNGNEILTTMESA